MNKGFAANLLYIDNECYSPGYILLNSNNNIEQYGKLIKELPFIKFLDGALRVERCDNSIRIYQLYPYDIINKKETENTRIIELKL